MAGQIILADIVFLIYAQVGVGWKISDPIIAAWLGATVIQVVGVVSVVAKHLFSGEPAGLL